MDRVYTICMIIGIGFPLISFVLGSIADVFDSIFDGISNLFEGIDIDFSFELGDTQISFLPVSFPSICAGLLVFGGLGKILSGSLSLLYVNIIAGVVAYLIASAIQTLILTLKSVENTTYAKEELLYLDATVVNTIVSGGFGSISIKTEDGINTTYPAKAENADISIKQNAIVCIVRFDSNTAIVREKESPVEIEDSM